MAIYNHTLWKICSKCKRELPATPDMFGAHRNTSDGFQSQCRECRNAYLRDYRATDAGRAQKKAYEQSERGKERMAAYHRSEKGKVALQRSAKKRRTFEQANESISHSAIQALLIAHKYRCWWCGTAIRGNKFHVDHRIPLSRGGTSGNDNLCISCPTCNMSKHDKLPQEWNGRLL